MSFYQVLLLLLLVAAVSEGADVQPSCGRVAGDQNIPPGRWPWVAVLYEQQRVFCSGSLISDQWVLTRAFCFQWVDPSDVTIVLGRNQMGSNPNQVSRGVNQTVCHPLFNPQTYENDICLVKLSSPVESSDHISPVCLATESSTFPNGTFSWIVGTHSGDREKLGELQLQILTDNECRRFPMFTANMICTRDDPSREELCLDGDGAPLLIHNDDRVWIQVGVSLFVQICRSPTNPPLYTRVSSYQEWISNVTGSCQTGFVTFPSSGDDGASTSTCSPPRTNTTTTVVPPEPNTTTTVVPPEPNTTTTVIPPELCTTPPVVPPRPTCDRSIFGSSEKLSSTFFTSVLALLSSLVVLLV